MKYLKITTAILSVLSLSGCLGSGGDKVAKAPVEEPPIVVEVVPATYIEKQNILGRLEKGALSAWGTTMNTDIDMPITGSANYAGIMELPDPTTDARMSGDLALNLDFDLASVTGIADNFSNSLDEVWSGQLDIEGDVNPTTIVFDAKGTLTSEAGLDTIVEVWTGVNIHLEDIDNTDPSAPEYIFGHLEGYMTTGSEWETVVSEFAAPGEFYGPADNSEFFVELVD